MRGLYGGIEAGGTKFVCVVGTNPNEIVEEIRFPTSPVSGETIRQALAFFAPYANKGDLAAIGIASFGPLDLNPASSTYGYITTTPKPGWHQVDLVGQFRRSLDLPVAFDTDVNAAAFGEYYWTPENRSLDPFVYMTVGTGIGVGVLVDGRPVHGLVHPEAGHFILPHDRKKDPFEGICPYHRDCLEGLASGTAMSARWGQDAETLPDTHPAWELEANYLALALVNLTYAYSPKRIVLGGGVALHPGLFKSVRSKVQEYLGGYIQSPVVLEKMDAYIVPPTLGNRSGVMGAIALAINKVHSG
jgi:fructokinase